MASTPENKQPLASFLEELYGEHKEDLLGLLEIQIEENDDEEEQEPEPPGSPSRKRARYFSKTLHHNRLSPSDTVIRGLTEDDIPNYEDQDDPLAADAHSLYPPEKRLNGRDVKDSKAHSGRGKTRVGRYGRGRPRGPRRGRGARDGGQFEEADPGVEEIWMTDDDVPLNLREVMDVVKRRVESSLNRNKLEKMNKGDDGKCEIEFVDANIAITNHLLESVDPRLEWFPMNTFRYEEETFKPERTGSVKSYTTAYDAFRAYWDDDIIQQIVDKANHYAEGIDSTNFQSEWYPTNTHEVLCLFAFWIMLGIIKMPTIFSCFSTNPLLKTEIFRQMFTLRRYTALARVLHFVDSVDNPDRLHHLRPIVSHLNAKFQANYVMTKDICIDESLTIWKRQHNFKRFKQTKATECGIKTYELCESSTSYLWSFLVDTGKENTFGLCEENIKFKSTLIVQKLITPLLNQGYRLFMDSGYISPLLARYLKSQGTDCIGPLHATAQDLPVIVTHAPLKKGQFIARHSGDVCVLSWQDYVRVIMLSTCHGSAVGLPTVPSHLTSRALPIRPQMVLDYNKSVGTVDQNDQMLEPYLVEGQRSAVYLMLFKRLLNSSILNSKILLECSTQRTLEQLAFRLDLVETVLTKHLSQCPVNRRVVAPNRTAHPARIVYHNHWPVHIPPNASCLAKNRQGRLRCVVCSSNKKDKKTPYKCETCDVALCVENCFKVYHSA